MENQDNIIVKPIKDITPISRRLYTPITNADTNCQTVRILKRLLSGKDGEISGIFTYFYQHLITNTQNPNLARALEEISIEEMLHAELLGKTIIAFGGNPRFSSDGMFWSTRRVNYNTNQNQFLKGNILAEENAILAYQNAISRITNQSLKQLLGEIIEDERKHIEILKTFLNT